MKKIIFFIAISLTSISFSQGNLQFNQVKLVSTLETVPNGKVWKVENILVNEGNLIGTNMNSRFYACTYKVNNIYCFITQSNNSSNISPTPGSFPFWLPEGSTLAAGTNINFLSVIEFNILP
jgi:hypothetical protein